MTPVAVGPPRRFLVDEKAARAVASAYTEATGGLCGALVCAAYADLETQSSRWFARLTADDSMTPVRVVTTRCAEPYSSAVELSESVRSHGLLELVPVLEDRDRSHPLLDGAVGGAHDRLRAVHDIVSHGWLEHDFSRDGEFSAWLAEDRMYTGLASWALATEVHAQHSVRWTTGQLPPHLAVLLDRRLLLTSMSRARSVS